MFRGCCGIRCRQFTPRAWRGKESHQWLKLTESVLTRIDQESEQLCSRQVEGRALMKLFKRAHGVSAGKREWGFREPLSPRIDRKSTRLNSSHLGISYAVFCLKK